MSFLKKHFGFLVQCLSLFIIGNLLFALKTKQEISWQGTLCALVLMLIAVPINWAFDKFWNRNEKGN